MPLNLFETSLEHVHAFVTKLIDRDMLAQSRSYRTISALSFQADASESVGFFVRTIRGGTCSPGGGLVKERVNPSAGDTPDR